MARVTKINVGGTNYDIAHEGELKNSGFEVVSALPTTGLFEGREVVYQGKKYVYSTFYSNWILTFDSKKEPVYNVMGSRGVYEILGYDYTTYSNQINRSYLSKYDNYCSYTDDFLIETSVDNETFIAIDRADKAYQIFSATNTYSWNVASYKAVRLTIGKSEILTVANILSFYINHQYLKVNKIKIDHQLSSDLSWEDFGEVDFTAVNPYNYALFFSVDMFSEPLGKYGSINKIRFTIEFDANSTNAAIYNVFLLREGKKYLTGINNYFNLSYKLLDCYSTIDYPITLNYDVNNIEPTQTGTVEKKANWVLRYLLQSVNWLKAKHNTKLDKRSYNQVYTNCGYTNIVSSTTGALIIELPFAPTNDTNNSMTYIELNVYSNKKGCSKYIIGVYSYTGSSEYEWSVYSYMGYNYFSSITQARRTDNNNIVIVLGNFTDVHKNEHFSISHIVTGFNRNNDDTDGFLLYTDSDSNNYNTLISSTYISPIISYNDLTDKPTLFSGSYDDLTDKPTLATVATSGSYDDLLNKPALVFSNIGGTISSIQIPDGLIGNTKLANSSMTLNGTTVNLGDTAILPWYVTYNGVDYPARVQDNWLEIYRNGVFVSLFYLSGQEPIQPTNVRQITSFANLDWYNEQVSEYEVDSNTTTSILKGTTLPATVLMNCLAEQLTINLYPISGKEYGKGSLDSLISDLKNKEFSVFVENDLDAIIGSGSDYLVRLKISKVPTTKAIIECYVAR